MVVETRQRYVLVDPTTLPMVPEFQGAPRLADLNNKRVGVIDDSKVNAKEYLEQLTDLLDQAVRHHQHQVPRKALRHPSPQTPPWSRRWRRSATM